jgi:nucleotide-binding universal stress UspA family protein
MPELWELDEHRAAHHRHMLEQRLREFVDGAGGPTTHFAVVQAANHGHGIVEYVRRVGADLIVLGAKGRSNLGYVLLGSTVERLLREIPCSALVVRPPPGGESMKETKTDNTTGGNDRVVKG